MSVTDNLSVNWRVLHDIRIKGTFSLSYDYGRNDAYVSPGSFAYINSNYDTPTTPDELYKRGKYTTIKLPIRTNGNWQLHFEHIVSIRLLSI